MSRQANLENEDMVKRAALTGSPEGGTFTIKQRAPEGRKNGVPVSLCFLSLFRRHVKTAPPGFTLLEVMVSLTILAIGVALALSLISGSLGNIRKVQQRTRTVEHAEAVMELALLDDSIRQPTAYSGDFEDGTRWSVRVEDYEMPEEPALQPRALPQNMPVKLLSYTVEMFSPGTKASDYRLQTLKLVNKTPNDQLMGAQ